jgi:hypothetical protein
MSDGPVASAADGIPNGMLYSGPDLNSGFAALHLQPLEVTVDGKQVLSL